jgi:hypothetical protein
MFLPLVAMFKMQSSITKQIPYMSLHYNTIEGTSNTLIFTEFIEGCNDDLRNGFYTWQRRIVFILIVLGRISETCKVKAGKIVPVIN